MRSLIVAFVMVSTTVRAQPALPPIDNASLPPSCTQIAVVPGDAAIPRPAIFARISGASCAAMARLSALQLHADDASVAAINEAVKPSLELYQSAIAQNDPVLTPIARAALADLYVSMAVRLRNAVPSITMSTVGAPLAEYVKAHAFVESKIGPWLEPH